MRAGSTADWDRAHEMGTVERQRRGADDPRDLPGVRGTPLVCPLCGGGEAALVGVCEYDAIWRTLQSVWGARISEEVRERHSPAFATSLYECGRCGLQYFAPSVAGDPEFYGQLMSSVRYWRERWEFGVVADQLDQARSVIDLGCGDGAFLHQAKSRLPNARIVGVDHNASAIARLRADGFEAYATDATDIADPGPESFDVVCAFQILEHTPDPTSLVAAARQLLAPEGRLFIAVPNRERVGRDLLEPFDSPPHHITRWSVAQFEFIADELNLRLESLSREDPVTSNIRVVHRRRAERRLAVLGPRSASQLARAYGWVRVPHVLHARRVRTGAYAARGQYGHTLLAELRGGA